MRQHGPFGSPAHCAEVVHEPGNVVPLLASADVLMPELVMALLDCTAELACELLLACEDELASELELALLDEFDELWLAPPKPPSPLMPALPSSSSPGSPPPVAHAAITPMAEKKMTAVLREVTFMTPYKYPTLPHPRSSSVLDARFSC